MTKKPSSPAKATYRVYADQMQRLFQDIEATSPQDAHSLAEDSEAWEVWHYDELTLSVEVKNLDTDEVTLVGRVPESNRGLATKATAPTPGPWHVGLSENPDVYHGEQHLCILPNPESTHGLLIADIETIPEAAANARLIAAAPDMLAALQVAANVMRVILLFDVPGSAEHQEHTRALDTMFRAIASATVPADDARFPLPFGGLICGQAHDPRNRKRNLPAHGQGVRRRSRRHVR